MGGAASTLLQQSNHDVLLQPVPEDIVSEEFSTIFSEKLYKNHISFVLEEKKGKEAYQEFLRREFPDADYSRIEVSRWNRMAHTPDCPIFFLTLNQILFIFFDIEHGEGRIRGGTAKEERGRLAPNNQ